MKRLATVLLAVLLVGSGLPAVAGAAPQTSDAELAIEQSEYIKQGVGTARADNSTVYIVHDSTIELKPQNFDTSNVVGFGVLTDAGELSYNERMGTYRFSAGNNTGTFELYWEVEQRRLVQQNNSTTTQTVRKRYTATIRVDSTKAYQHIPAGSLQDIRQDAKNWESWESSLKSIWGPDVNIQKKTQISVNWNKAAANPTKVLGGSSPASCWPW